MLHRQRPCARSPDSHPLHTGSPGTSVDLQSGSARSLGPHRCQPVGAFGCDGLTIPIGIRLSNTQGYSFLWLLKFRVRAGASSLLYIHTAMGTLQPALGGLRSRPGLAIRARTSSRGSGTASAKACAARRRWCSSSGRLMAAGVGSASQGLTTRMRLLWALQKDQSRPEAAWLLGKQGLLERCAMLQDPFDRKLCLQSCVGD